ncbi:MAG: DUF4317 domain-containing protein [Lachnospiraceae bacterium]|nr:DUF4317 domain-containing protein [Lachnospiraceae bacterium]
MKKINREDMLELTRRMTLKRNCFTRIAGAYMDAEGFVDGTFNTGFSKLSAKEQEKNLAIAKAVLFSETNINLREYGFSKEQEGKKSVWQLLMALKSCELENDALLEVFYEKFGQVYHAKQPYAIYFFQGNYDVPLKASDKMVLGESEEVYQFIICAVCPVYEDYQPGEPEWGFLFPAFSNRSSDIHGIDIFDGDIHNPHLEVLEHMILCEA